MSVWKDCRSCRYGDVRGYKFVCMGRKGAPEVNPNMVCDYWKPFQQTNADRIRAMSDEELAEWHKQMMEGYCPRQTSECPSDCYECWLDWLKQEVKE